MSLYVRTNIWSSCGLLLETPVHQTSLSPSLFLLTCFLTISFHFTPCFSLPAQHVRRSATWLSSSYMHTCAPLTNPFPQYKLYTSLLSSVTCQIVAGYLALLFLDFASVNSLCTFALFGLPYNPFTTSACLLSLPVVIPCLAFITWTLCQPVSVYIHSPACQCVSAQSS